MGGADGGKGFGGEGEEGFVGGVRGEGRRRDCGGGEGEGEVLGAEGF